jgi:hypothetical protein
LLPLSLPNNPNPNPTLTLFSLLSFLFSINMVR